MAGPVYLIADKATGFFTHVTVDPTVAANFAKDGAAVLDFPTSVYTTMAVVQGNVSTGNPVPTLVGVSAADLPVPSVSSGGKVTSA